MDEFEIRFVKYFNKIKSKKLNIFLAFVNSIGFLIFFWTVLVILAVTVHPEISKPFLVAVLLVAILHFGITEGIIKHLMTHIVSKRKRPYVKFPEIIRPIGRQFSDSSFPSSHVTTTVAMFFVITSFYPSLIVIAILMILMMAFSRLHNGMHYPTDILAGIFLGVAYGYVAFGLMRIFF